MPGNDISLGTAVFDSQVREVEGPDQVTEFQNGFQINVYAYLGTVFLRFMHGEVEDARSLCASGKRIFLVPGEPSYAETLGVHGAVFSVPVNQVEHGVVPFFDDGNIKGVFTSEKFVLNPHDFEHACIVNDQHVIQRGAFADRVSLLDAVTGKAFVINIQCFIGNSHLRAVYGAEGGNFRFPRIGGAVFFTQGFKPADSEFGKLVEVLLRLFDVLFKLADVLVRLESVKFGNPLDFDFRQPYQVVPGNGGAQPGCKRLQFPVNGAEHFFPRFGIFYGEVDAVFNEYFFQACLVPRLVQFLESDFLLLAQDFLGGVRIVAQDVADTHEPGFFLHNDAGIRGGQVY